jgi:hypothetical protein
LQVGPERREVAIWKVGEIILVAMWGSGQGLSWMIFRAINGHRPFIRSIFSVSRRQAGGAWLKNVLEVGSHCGHQIEVLEGKPQAAQGLGSKSMGLRVKK